MSEGTTIEWTDDTCNPIRARTFVDDMGSSDPTATREVIGWHCEHVSPGCKNCYAEAINRRLGTGLPFRPASLIHEGPGRTILGDVEVFLDEKVLVQPLKRKRGRQIFMCSMTDIAANFVTDAMLDKVFAMMLLSPRHRYQVLTKRPDRLAEYLGALNNAKGFDRLEAAARSFGYTFLHDTPDGAVRVVSDEPMSHIWFGVSVEDERSAVERRDALRQISWMGLHTWVSYEPALGPVNWDGFDFIEWLVGGGESGSRARPSHPDWHRAARDWCASRGVHYVHKQWGAWAPPAERVRCFNLCSNGVDGETMSDGTSYASTCLNCEGSGLQPYIKVGKKAAGRLLDGQLHDAYPPGMRL